MAVTAVVCYDISADSARARAAAYLQQWGDRIQRSVFVCAIAADQVETVRGRLASLIDVRTDTVHIVPSCGTCWSRLIVIGQADRRPEVPYWAVW